MKAVNWSAVRRRTATTSMVAFSIFCSIMTATLASISGNTPGWNQSFGLILNTIAAIMLIWRRQIPSVVLAVAVVGPCLFETDATAAMFALFAVVRVTRGWRLAAAVAIGYAAAVVSLIYDAYRRRDSSVLTIGQTNEPGQPVHEYQVSLWIAFVVAAFLLVLVVGGALISRTKSALTMVETSRDAVVMHNDALRDEVIRADERTRIARDMHDTLAASLSRISLFAGGLQVSGADNPQKTANTAAMIQRAAHEANDELRGIIGVMRGNADGQGQTGPQDITAVAELVAASRLAGVHMVLSMDLPGETIGTIASNLTYRVVREALTNAHKYASDQIVRVTIAGEPQTGLRTAIRTARSYRPPSMPPGSGSGLLGLQERVHSVGGKFASGWDKQEFVVYAWLPWSM